jgi:N-acetyl sugar amidotransferase
MKYCNNCIQPDTRPGIIINETGTCNACINHLTTKENIDWTERENEFRKVVRNTKNTTGYDCVIPVSGGKDSTWQVIKCLEYGMKPLTVTWRTPGRTNIGQKNLDNLINLGVDHIDFSINPEVEKKFMLEALKKYGATAIPMHTAIFNIPVNIACKFNIPLIVWGENSAFEYGTDDEKLTGFELNSEWLKKFGVTHGTTAKDWISDELTEKELTPYFGPKDQEIKTKGIKAVFLGYYFKWDVETSLKAAKEKGFKASNTGAKTGYYNYADIDDDFISIHHYLKWYKFGMTRLFDNLSLEIRNKRITRNRALSILKEKGEQKPIDDIKKFCTFVSISENKFYEIIEKFRNLDIWEKQKDKWKIKNFILNNWDW